MKPFVFAGGIPASKSLMNRALILQSHFPELEIQGDSDCDDVLHMRTALENFRKGEEIFCGEAGTVIRFMALRCSRVPGSFRLTAHPRLLERPHDDLVALLDQLKVRCEIDKTGIRVTGNGWENPSAPLVIPRDKTSQFASSLILNCWNLPFSLRMENRSGISEGYLQMTLSMVSALGLKLKQDSSGWFIAPGQRPSVASIHVEPDFSSAFAIAAAGVLAGHTEINSLPANSLQPDSCFFSIFDLLGAKTKYDGKNFHSFQTLAMKAIEFELGSCPDLFPVLSVLCAFARGKSVLFGAPQLAFKESNRILKTTELLRACGILVDPRADGLEINGDPDILAKAIEKNIPEIHFDSDHDHRMAMAAGLLKRIGFPIKIENPEVVSKSYPDFWRDIGLNL